MPFVLVVGKFRKISLIFDLISREIEVQNIIVILGTFCLDFYQRFFINDKYSSFALFHEELEYHEH